MVEGLDDSQADLAPHETHHMGAFTFDLHRDGRE